MSEVTVYLRTGETMIFECESITLTKNGLNYLTGYKVEHGESKNKILYLEVEQIIGIVTKKI